MESDYSTGDYLLVLAIIGRPGELVGRLLALAGQIVEANAACSRFEKVDLEGWLAFARELSQPASSV